MKTVEELFNEFEASDELRNELKAIRDDSALAEFLKKHGCDASAAEFKSFIKSICDDENEGEISDDAVEAVAGGASADEEYNKILEDANRKIKDMYEQVQSGTLSREEYQKQRNWIKQRIDKQLIELYCKDFYH